MNMQLQIMCNYILSVFSLMEWAILAWTAEKLFFISKNICILSNAWNEKLRGNDERLERME